MLWHVGSQHWWPQPTRKLVAGMVGNRLPSHEATSFRSLKQLVAVPCVCSNTNRLCFRKVRKRKTASFLLCFIMSTAINKWSEGSVRQSRDKILIKRVLLSSMYYCRLCRMILCGVEELFFGNYLGILHLRATQIQAEGWNEEEKEKN